MGSKVVSPADTLQSRVAMIPKLGEVLHNFRKKRIIDVPLVREEDLGGQLGLSGRREGVWKVKGDVCTTICVKLGFENKIHLEKFPRSRYKG